jgi:hypothetical protein
MESSVVVIDDDLASVVIEIPITVALPDDDGVPVAVIATLANDLALANDIAVAVAMTDGHTHRAHAHPDFFRAGRQCGPDQRGSRYGSKTKFHVSRPVCPLCRDNPAREQMFHRTSLAGRCEPDQISEMIKAEPSPSSLTSLRWQGISIREVGGQYANPCREHRQGSAEKMTSGE